jgi:hypothetical protein
MAKRFIDTKIWDKAWFRRLTPKNKLFWIYLLTRCDHAGIWDADWEAAEFLIGEWVDYDELPTEITAKMEYIKGDDQYFIPKFIEFQYGILKPNSKPHLSVIKRLTQKGLMKGIESVYVTLKAKDKVKYQSKDQSKVKEKTDKRADKFALDAVKIGEEWQIEGNLMCEFINYWTEMNKGETKFKAEMQQTFDIKRRLNKWIKNNKEWEKPKKEHKSFEAKFGKTKTGLYLAYCSKCGKKEMPNDSWQLKDGSSCCRVEYVEDKPENAQAS